MSDSKISALPAAAALTGAELVPVVQSGNSVRTTVSAVQNNALGIYIAPGVGAVARTVSAKLSDVVSVLDFGADPTNTIDSTAAIIAASQSNMTVFFPSGLYKVANLVITGKNNLAWVGAAAGGVGLTTTTPGVMVTFTAGNFCTIDGLSFSPTGTLANSTGLLFTNGHSNSTVRNCVFQLWTNAGHRCTGTAGSPLSGNKVYDCFFLQCASVAATGQLDMTYNNDYFTTHNQFGTIGNGSLGYPSIGANASNCSNGQFDSNFVWQNTVGANFSNCAYDRIFSNRFEQSQKEGAIFTSCTVPMFNNNWLNNNGNLTTNTYNDLRWIGCTGMTIEGNQSYNWLGAAPQTKYACSIESSCSGFIIRGNKATPGPAGYATAAWRLDPTIGFTGNTTDGSMNFTSGATVPVGTTTFLGLGVSGNVSVCAQYLSVNHTVVQLVVECSVAAGAGQSFVYTLYKNGVATALTVTLTGAGAFQSAANATTVIEDISNNAQYTVQLVTSAAAGVANHFAQVVFCGK